VTSQAIVLRARASSWTPIVAAGDRSSAPRSVNTSSVVTGEPGTSVTSAITASIATVPTSGTRRPRTSASARFDAARGQPSPYPSGSVAIRLGRSVRHDGP